MTVQELALIILRAQTFDDAKRQIEKITRQEAEARREDDAFYDFYGNEGHLGQD